MACINAVRMCSAIATLKAPNQEGLTDQERVTQWQAATGATFPGRMVPLGALIYYRSKGNATISHPSTRPGFFAGWRIDSGLRYRKIVRILDYEKIKNKESACTNMIDVPEEELFVPDEITFPMFEARQLALKQMSVDPQLPEAAPLALPFDQEGSDQTKPEVEDKPRLLKVTVDRIIRFGPTPGCANCKVWTGKVHTPECRARIDSLVRLNKMQHGNERRKS